MVEIKPLPKLPAFNMSSPKIVIILDKIRFELENDKTNDYSEVALFLREYPRIYRHHIECAEFRLKNIYRIYESAYNDLVNKIKKGDENCFEFMISGYEIKVLYWEFDALLSSINISLDIIARILSSAFKEDIGYSFNKFCKKNYDNKYIKLFKEEKVKWVKRLKEYRDCFTHFTVVDTILSIVARKYKDCWEIRCKLPINPYVRDILKFKFNRKTELLKYAINIYKRIIIFDKKIAKIIENEYKNKLFPIRINNLFN